VSRENAHVKARRLLTEGRVRILNTSEDDGFVSAEVRGDSACVYNVRFEARDGGWSCTCPTLGVLCLHVRAVQLVVVVSRGRGRRELASASPPPPQTQIGGSVSHEPFVEVAEGVIVRPMLTINDAIDLFDGDCARRGLTDKTRATYRGILYGLADQYPARWDVAKLTTEDVDRFLAQRGKKHARGTRAHAECVLNSFFKCLYRQEKIKRNPVDRLQRTRRLPPEALDVTSVSSAEVLRLFEAADTWAERLCLAILAYLGPRRRAAARPRLVDYDRLRGRLRFHEKGGKTIWKPIPDPLRSLLDAAIAAGAIVEGSDIT
jgi:hypothetical protein